MSFNNEFKSMKNNYYFLLLIWMVCITPSAHAVWLSPDPLLDKYPNISPYAYCNNNPVKYVDPDGRMIVVRGRNVIERFAAKFGISIGYFKQVKNDLAQLQLDNKEVGHMITTLEESDNVHIIIYPQNRWNKSGPMGDKNDKEGRGSIIEYDPNNYESRNGDKRTPRVGLAHETKHSLFKTCSSFFNSFSILPPFLALNIK